MRTRWDWIQYHMYDVQADTCFRICDYENSSGIKLRACVCVRIKCVCRGFDAYVESSFRCHIHRPYTHFANAQLNLSSRIKKEQTPKRSKPVDENTTVKPILPLQKKA